MSCEWDRGARQLAADFAFPVMANFAAFDEFRMNGRDHPVATLRAARGIGVTANIRKADRVGVIVHRSRPPVSPSLDVRSKGAKWRCRDGQVKLWWPEG